MEDFTVRRTLSGWTSSVRGAMWDLEAFMNAAGFDRVDVNGDLLHVANGVGVVTIELTLKIVDGPDAALAYEQREGIFEEMRTESSAAFGEPIHPRFVVGCHKIRRRFPVGH